MEKNSLERVPSTNGPQFLPSASLNEQKVFNAAGHVMINGMKPQTALNRLIEACAGICASMGIKPPTPTLLNQECEFIQKFFGEFTVEEILLAFDMNAAGELGEVLGHFNSFDKIFIGGVLNKYRIYRQNTLKAHRPYKEPETVMPDQKAITEGENSLLLLIHKDFIKFREEPECEFISLKIKMKLLERKGLLLATKEEKNMWYQQAIKKYASIIKGEIATGQQKFTTKINTIIQECERGLTPDTEKERIMSVARDLAIRYYFSEWIRGGIDFYSKIQAIIN